MWGVCLIQSRRHTEVVTMVIFRIKILGHGIFFPALIKQGLFDFKLQHVG